MHKMIYDIFRKAHDSVKVLNLIIKALALDMLC